MSLVPGTIIGTGQAIVVELNTARVPELPNMASVSQTARIPVWDDTDNTTKYMTPQQMREFVGGTPVEQPPVISGADLEIEIPPSLYGQTAMPVPALAGKDYSLERINQGRMWSSWFNSLSTGGFQLTRPGDVFVPGDKFVAHIYELEGGNSGGGGGETGGGSPDRGFKLIDASYTITPADFGYRFKVSAGNNKVTITLPALADTPDKTEISIITIVGNDWQTVVQSVNGEFLYVGPFARTSEIMGHGESLRLKKDSDGWYAIEGTVGNYTDAGMPEYGYVLRPNTLIGEGQLVRRDSYPRLWREVQLMGPSLISDAQWGSSVDYQGCFSTGDGTTTFRLPNVRGTSYRMMDGGRGLDTNGRTHPYPGGFQADNIKSHDHALPADMLYQGTAEGGIQGSEDWQTKPGNRTPSTGMSENTVKNTGILGLIKT